MIKFKIYFYKTPISFLLITVLGYQSYCQIDTTNCPKEAIVYRKYVNFHVNDSIIPFTLFASTKLFYFRDGFIDNPGLQEYRLINNKTYKVIYPLITDTIINIYSAFPKLNTNDFTISSDNDTIKWVPNKNWVELNNSFLLNSLEEPSLYYCGDKQSIRVICMLQDNIYRFIRIEFNENEISINCSNAEVKADATFQLFWNTSCSIPKKQDKDLEQTIHNISFGSEPYYSNLNLNKYYPTDRVIIEYRDGSKYYILQKPKNDKPYRKLVKMMMRLSLKCKI
jgi:hypothetical protein